MKDFMQELQDQKFALDQSAIVAQTDARGQITMVNDKFCEISGYSRMELIGKDHRIVNSGTHPKSFFLEMWRTIGSGKVWRGEICNRKKTGELYWVATTITPFLNSEGRPYQYLAIRQDITALKLAQKTIVEQQAQLVNASRLSAIGEMAAAVTHEINNPLAVILGRAEMMQNLISRGKTDPETLTRLADTILTTGRRIEKIVRSMRALSHQGDPEEPVAAVPVREIISDAIELCTQRFRNHSIKLTVPEVDPALTVECHGHQIVQVLINLLNNSFDAISEKDERWVKLELEDQDAQVLLSVTDSGPGIPPEARAKLFEPFFSTKRVQYGTGLGLSISRSIISNNGGALNYDEDCANTRFVICLPKRRTV